MEPPAASGERVTEETCWGIVAVYRAISMIGNDLARLPVSVTTGEGRAASSVVSPVADLLQLDANRYHGGFEFRRTLTTQCLRYGNAFAQIVRSGRGEILERSPGELVEGPDHRPSAEVRGGAVRCGSDQRVLGGG